MKVSSYLNILALLIFVFFSSASSAFDEFSIVSKDLYFTSKGVTLAGTLIAPVASGPRPALVIIDGSGATLRKIPYAQTIARKGIAVFTYDKRGVGRSGGKYVEHRNASKKNLELLASDAIAAVEMLSNHLAIDSQKIGIWGGSQGGWIVPIVASKLSNVAFMVILSGPTVSVSTQMKYSRLIQKNNAILNDYSDSEIEQMLQKKTFLDKLLQVMGVDFDPIPYLKKITIPGLWIYGAQDESVPVHTSVNRLKFLNKKNFEIKEYPAYGHSLPKTETVEYFVKWIYSHDDQ